MFLERAEAFLNRRIAESTRAQECRARLRGRSLGLDVAGLGPGLTFRVEDAAVRLTRGVEDSVDVRIASRPSELLALLEADSAADLRRSRAEVRGDLRVAEDFSALFRHARPDAEDELGRWFGVIPAHVLASLVRGALHWSIDAARASEQNVADYLKSESRIVPAPSELARFAREVERTRDDVARLEQRIGRLAKAIAARSE